MWPVKLNYPSSDHSLLSSSWGSTNPWKLTEPRLKIEGIFVIKQVSRMISLVAHLWRFVFSRSDLYILWSFTPTVWIFSFYQLGFQLSNEFEWISFTVVIIMIKSVICGSNLPEKLKLWTFANFVLILLPVTKIRTMVFARENYIHPFAWSHM